MSWFPRRRSKRLLLSLAALSLAASLTGLGLDVPAASAAHPAAVTAATGTGTATTTNGTGGDVADVVSPDITWTPSCSGWTTWVLIFEFPLPSRGVSHWCFGYTGTWTFPSNGNDQATYFCAGNNHGSIKVKWQGTVRTYSFTGGTKITWQPGSATLISLTITGWSGTNRCQV